MSEKVEIHRDKAKAQKNSGRGKISKGDAIWNGYVVDYKETGKTFGLSEKVWTKVCTDALTVGRSLMPLIKVIIGEGNKKIRLGVIDWDRLDELERFWHENH